MISSLINSIIIAIPLCGIVFVLNVVLKKKLHITWWDIILRCAFIGYGCVLLIQTLLDRPHLKEYEIAYPFQSLINAFKDGSIYTWQYFLINVAIFMPYGVLVPPVFSCKKPLKAVLISAPLASLFIEILQLITKMGIFETDDIITNTLGAVFGCLIYIAINNLISRGKENDRYQ